MWQFSDCSMKLSINESCSYMGMWLGPDEIISTEGTQVDSVILLAAFRMSLDSGEVLWSKTKLIPILKKENKMLSSKL